ncbi:MAG: acetate--CoA ligase family protein [Polaromonas sp.]|uniref:acetate--CoA ligase family protein n=1 Tax=Polaromonas sp. TaxID=1869339 RepID=UPI0024898B76|nr:acetate--CoA ligase family protein [Polaromonas sp.]MDI1240002.1 acetate--CoA ligase family protein [Polaromonas sp.]
MSLESSNLARLLDPRAIVLVGASDRSAFSRSAWKNLQDLGYSGALHLVSRSGGMAHGQQTHSSCAEIGEVVDVALVMVPIAAMDEVLRDVARCGARYAVVLAGGFAETGDAGRQLQEEMVRTAHQLGITLLGPNCLGFINFTRRAACWTGSMRAPALTGPISIVSQSGAIATFAKHFAHQQGIGLHCVISTGNESMLDLSAVADHLLDDADNRVIALFIESIRDVARFRALARRAIQLGKPLVVLKVGRSPLATQAAQSHTGSIVGDDSVFDGVCKQFGLVRVRSIEEMVLTSRLLAMLGPLDGKGVAFLSVSGGMGELGADYAHMEDIFLPEFAPATLDALREALPAYATPANPLDMTGGAINDPRLLTRALDTVMADPGVALTVCIADVPTGLNDDWTPHFVSSVHEIGRATTGAKRPVVVISHTMKYVSDQARALAAEAAVPYLAAGADLGMKAVRHALSWSAQYARSRAVAFPQGNAVATATAEHPHSEWESLRYLAGFEVPVVPAVLATSADAAIAAAQASGGPVVLKIASPDIAHKTEVGGVKLNLSGPDAVAEAYRAITTSVAAAAPAARIDGVLVVPMRRQGVELFVGVRRDPEWGHVLALGLGGVWIEALKDVSLRLLPITSVDVHDMLGELRGTRLLQGFRGAPAADLDRIAQTVARIGDAALALGATLDTLEVNPLLVDGSRVEALDALVTYADRPGTSAH